MNLSDELQLTPVEAEHTAWLVIRIVLMQQQIEEAT